MATPRYLVVVRRGERELFERLRAEYAAVPDEVQVIWDRRVRDRRVIIRDDMPKERRTGQRRAPVDEAMWRARGYLIVPAGTADESGWSPVTIRRTPRMAARSPRG